MAINRTLIDYAGRIKHVSMLDYAKIGDLYLKLRKRLKLNLDFDVHNRADNCQDCLCVSGPSFIKGVRLTAWKTAESLKDSGLFGAIVGRLLGYKSIRLLGCPGDGGGHYYDTIESAPVVTQRILGNRDFISKNMNMFDGVRATCGPNASFFGVITSRDRQYTPKSLILADLPADKIQADYRRSL